MWRYFYDLFDDYLHITLLWFFRLPVLRQIGAHKSCLSYHLEVKQPIAILKTKTMMKIDSVSTFVQRYYTYEEMFFFLSQPTKRVQSK